MPKKHKHNKPSTNTNTKPAANDIDHGPATVVFCFPANKYRYEYLCRDAEKAEAKFAVVAQSRRDADKAFDADASREGWEIVSVEERPILLRELGVREPGSTDYSEVRGFMAVKSATENFSVREISVEPPVLERRYTFHCLDEDGGEKEWGVSAKSLKDASDVFYRDSSHAAWLVQETKETTRLIRGPRLVSIRAVQFECPSCGRRVMSRDEVVAASTKPATVTVRKDNGKTFTKSTRVAKDDGKTEVHTLRDLDGHKMVCPICQSAIDGVKGKVWRLSDREVVSPEWEERIRKLVKEATDKRSLFQEAIPAVVGVRADLDHRPSWGDLVSWSDLKAGGSIGGVYVQCPETSVLVLDDAQKLDEMSFGSRDDRLSYSGSVAFKPRKIRQEEEDRPQRPLVTIGDVVDFDFGLDA